ncbi:MAG: hypothetical protein H6Q59_2725 [Firmicutes bacterium]|nr:hypothetical protein [Bacillota bacterium]
MKKRLTRYLAGFLLFLLTSGIVIPATALAASAEVELSADASQITLGDEFFLYVNVTSQTEFGDFEGSVTYDEDILEYQGGARQIKGSDGYLTISDRDNTDGDTKRKYTMKFEATKVGICTIEFADRAIVYELGGAEMSVSSNTLTINVVAPITASGNAKLKDLKISPSVLKPDFKADVYEYSTEVDAEVVQLVLVAIPEDDKAKVSILGNEALTEGENKITISVLAESGDVIEYNIKAVKAAAPEASVTPGGELLPDNIHGNFEVKKIDGDKFAIYSGQYKLLEPGSDVIVPAGYIRTKMIISDVSVTVFYPEGDMESNYLLTYAENELGEAGFYRYDKIERTLQRYEPGVDKVVNQANDTNMEDLITSETYRTNLTKAAVVIAVLSGLCALLIVLCIRFLLKSRGYKDDDLD